MSPPPPKRPPRAPRVPGEKAPRPEQDLELPFDDDEVAPLQADDPRPQRVPQFPAGPRRRPRRGAAGGLREGKDREMPARFTSGEYEDPGHAHVFLYVEKGPGAGQLLPIKQGALVIGRASTSDLRLQHPSISRRHAQLTRRDEHLFLKDLGSQNGTYVNRTRVGGEIELLAGDEIAVGNAVLRIRGPGYVPERLPEDAPREGDTPRSALPRRLTLVAAVAAGSLVAVVLLLGLIRATQARRAPPRPAPMASTSGAPDASPETAAPLEPSATPAQAPSRAPTPIAAPVHAESIAGTPRPSSSRGTSPSSSRAGGREKAPTERPGRKASPTAGAVVPSDEAEAEVLAAYEAGRLDLALAQARSARLERLGTRLKQFQDAWRAGNAALVAKDADTALEQLTLAYELDQQLAGGWGSFAPRIREALQQARSTR